MAAIFSNLFYRCTYFAPPPPPPIAPLIHVFTPFFGRIHVVTLVEVLFSRAHTSCCSYGTICNDSRFFPYAAWVLGGTKPPPNRSIAEVWWGSRWQGPLELQKSGILRYKIHTKNSTLGFSFLVQNELKRKDHPFDVPNKANYKFARI